MNYIKLENLFRDFIMLFGGFGFLLVLYYGQFVFHNQTIFELLFVENLAKEWMWDKLNLTVLVIISYFVGRLLLLTGKMLFYFLSRIVKDNKKSQDFFPFYRGERAKILHEYLGEYRHDDLRQYWEREIYAEVILFLFFAASFWYFIFSVVANKPSCFWLISLILFVLFGWFKIIRTSYIREFEDAICQSQDNHINK